MMKAILVCEHEDELRCVRVCWRFLNAENIRQHHMHRQAMVSAPLLAGLELLCVEAVFQTYPVKAIGQVWLSTLGNASRYTTETTKVIPLVLPQACAD